jgi:hypothetical protein
MIYKKKSKVNFKQNETKKLNFLNLKNEIKKTLELLENQTKQLYSILKKNSIY